MGKRVALVLAGCGVFDGSEVHEASAALVHLSRGGAQVRIFAPNIEQMHVVDHFRGSPTEEKRNVLVESARLARGNIEDLAELKVGEFDAVIFPAWRAQVTTQSSSAQDGVPGSQKSSSMDQTGAANLSPSQRLVKIRRRKQRTRDDMFSELQISSHADRAQQNAWRQSMSECKKAQYEREERWWAESRAEVSKWRAEEDRWRQLADRRQESMLRLLEHQTDMLQRMVDLQERQQEQRPPLQPLCNQQPSSPSSIASSLRHPRTQCGGLWPPSHSTPDDCPSIRRLAFNKC
ncbi:uncharacterized protein LOC101939976 isoform X1 [Chrysemys picta bellii]|uniref:uncharacterized protein LOC101939976 isoform X1 n=1 Tax=Chrysemys picta bellii TaxID=8478 RepID=UPI0032B1D990